MSYHYANLAEYKSNVSHGLWIVRSELDYLLEDITGKFSVGYFDQTSSQEAGEIFNQSRYVVNFDLYYDLEHFAVYGRYSHSYYTKFKEKEELFLRKHDAFFLGFRKDKIL